MGFQTEAPKKGFQWREAAAECEGHRHDGCVFTRETGLPHMLPPQCHTTGDSSLGQRQLTGPCERAKVGVHGTHLCKLTTVGSLSRTASSRQARLHLPASALPSAGLTPLPWAGKLTMLQTHQGRQEPHGCRLRRLFSQFYLPSPFLYFGATLMEHTGKVLKWGLESTL